MQSSLKRPDGAVLIIERLDFRVPYRRDVGPRVPIVLHHGMGRGMDWFYEWLPVLGEARREVYRFDARACGQSTAPEDGWGVDELVADARAIIELTGAKQVDWIGFDSGGMIALALAAKDQSIFRSMTLINTPFTFRQEILDRYRLGYPTEGAAIRALGLRHYFESSKGIRVSNVTAADPDMVEWQTNAQVQVPPGPAGDQIDQFHSMETEELIKTFNVPTLIIVGDRSPLAVLEDQVRAYRSMKNAGLAVVPHMAGGVNLQAATECAKLATAFIARLETAARG